MKRLLITIFFLQGLLAPSLEAQFIWPGDINNNGIVNGVDVLYWGAAFNATGSQRADQSSNWAPAPVPAAWPQFFSNGLNYLFADCNGDGVVDEDDFDTIEDNFGEVQGTRMPEGFVNAEPGSPAPRIVLSTQTPVVLPGATVNIDFSLDDSAMPVEDFYGIALSLRYETNLLEGDDGLDYDMLEESWMSADNSYVQELFVDNKGNGTAMLAITRTNQETLPIQSSGIGQFSIVIQDIILDLDRDTLSIAVDSVWMINDRFQSIPTITDKIEIIIAKDTSATQDSTTVIVKSQSFQDEIDSQIEVFPNPSKGVCFISSPFPIQDLLLYDQLGRVWIPQFKKLGLGLYQIHGIDLPAGIFGLQIRARDQILTRKLILLNNH